MCEYSTFNALAVHVHQLEVETPNQRAAGEQRVQEVQRGAPCSGIGKAGVEAGRQGGGEKRRGV